MLSTPIPQNTCILYIELTVNSALCSAPSTDLLPQNFRIQGWINLWKIQSRTGITIHGTQTILFYFLSKFWVVEMPRGFTNAILLKIWEKSVGFYRKRVNCIVGSMRMRSAPCHALPVHSPEIRISLSFFLFLKAKHVEIATKTVYFTRRHCAANLW